MSSRRLPRLPPPPSDSFGSRALPSVLVRLGALALASESTFTFAVPGLASVVEAREYAHRTAMRLVKRTMFKDMLLSVRACGKMRPAESVLLHTDDQRSSSTRALTLARLS